MRSRWETGQYSRTFIQCDGGTEKARPARRWLSVFKPVGLHLRKIRDALCRDVMTKTPQESKWSMPCFQEKPLSFSCIKTVPQTDTGGQVENTKALERTRVKELGKMAP